MLPGAFGIAAADAVRLTMVRVYPVAAEYVQNFP